MPPAPRAPRNGTQPRDRHAGSQRPIFGLPGVIPAAAQRLRAWPASSTLSFETPYWIFTLPRSMTAAHADPVRPNAIQSTAAQPFGRVGHLPLPPRGIERGEGRAVAAPKWLRPRRRGGEFSLEIHPVLPMPPRPTTEKDIVNCGQSRLITPNNALPKKKNSLRQTPRTCRTCHFPSPSTRALRPCLVRFIKGHGAN